MNLVMILSACASLSLAADAPKDDAAKKELERLQGTWVIELAKFEGVDDPRYMKGKKITIVGDQLTLIDETANKLTIKIDLSKKPFVIDLQDAEHEKKKWPPLPGIFEIDGDTLRLAIAEASGTAKTDGKKIFDETFTVGKRPTSFDGKEGHTLVMKREKK